MTELAAKEVQRLTPDVSVISTDLGFAPPQLAKDIFRAHTNSGIKALVVTGWATGTVHEGLLPLIHETTERGISVFVLSNNPGEDHGIKTLKYEPHVKVVGAGAIPLRDVNVNKGQEVLEAIQDEIDHGKTGKELNDVIAERFGTPIPQTTLQ